eukprot:GEMP01066328.1.p1 GENE.GEMP01066328.1~~GEMP01066328.1.p1  ORF type:complete len:102 (+),score=16.51 GEMP01066328.1:45-350(+)
MVSPPGRLSVAPPPPPPILLFVSDAKTAKTVWVEISANDPVKNLKSLLERKTGVLVDQMVLIYEGEELKNQYIMKECRLKQQSLISLLNLADTPDEITEGS